MSITPPSLVVSRLQSSCIPRNLTQAKLSCIASNNNISVPVSSTIYLNVLGRLYNTQFNSWICTFGNSYSILKERKVLNFDHRGIILFAFMDFCPFLVICDPKSKIILSNLWCILAIICPNIAKLSLFMDNCAKFYGRIFLGANSTSKSNNILRFRTALQIQYRYSSHNLRPFW